VKTTDFDYSLPQEFIAQTPIEPRDTSRLMVVDRSSGQIHEHTIFREIGRFLRAGDLLVLNETRVIPARIFARKIPTGGRIEVLLLKRIAPQTWECFVGGKGLVPGKRIQFEDGPQAEILEVLGGPRRLIRSSEPLRAVLSDIGQMPLPPYIHEKLEQPERYQTVYARESGSAAAPTAGLHFTPTLLETLKNLGVNIAMVTLHVGLDTFAPVKEDDPNEHEIHTEWCHMSDATAENVNRTKLQNGRVIAVGTTSVRTLESAATQTRGSGKWVQAISGPTGLFILPGYEFKVVDAVITNFHLPRSTLIMLVSAFLGREQVLAAYEEAKRAQYRFYSFGDAMLIV
jgi:S-adenosylmethionine:tRNA ribosyltransferase-isomerase